MTSRTTNRRYIKQAQAAQARADGSQEWMVSRTGTGSMFSVVVAADGSFGPVSFAY